MKRQIELHKRVIPYTLRVSARARTLRLSIYRDGTFVVTAPRYASQITIEDFIFRKSQWVLDKIDRAAASGSMVLNIFAKKSKVEYKKYKDQALALAERKVCQFNALYNYRVNRIRIKNQKTRWGSCSKKGNLNFNYKIALLPETLSDYLVVHELCHLGQFNHSVQFWNLVAKTIPDYKERRRELRKIEIGR